VTNPNPNLNQSLSQNANRTTLGRFDIQAEADLHAAVVNVQFNKRLRESFGAADVAMIATVASELGRNILKYGGGRGHLLVTWMEDGTGRGGGVEIKAVDYGSRVSRSGEGAEGSLFNRWHPWARLARSRPYHGLA
jgi:two-component sensor histidine kinase